IRRHVGEHDIRAAAEHVVQHGRSARIEEIDPAKRNAGDRRNVQNIDRDDLAPALGRPDAPCRDVAPAARRGPEIDHMRTRFEQAVLVVDLDQLVRGTRAHALALGAHDIRIVELALEPALLRDGAVLLCFQPHLERTLAHDACPWLAAQTLSARINSTSMPSRKPRSATRSRSHGKTRRIASRIAQPASTRSARSEPMQGLATRSSDLLARSSSSTAAHLRSTITRAITR